ncbi:MAG TPA: hypothetical protein VGZ23_14605 [bacterium]|nr:hypothetical protein [bacterium]
MADTGRRGSISSGMGWMFLISLLLFWLPVIGPLIAGLVGGKKAGGVGPALVAVFLPIIATSIVLSFAGSVLTGIPLIGALVGMGALAVLLLHVGPLLLGAIIGGALA